MLLLWGRVGPGAEVFELQLQLLSVAAIWVEGLALARLGELKLCSGGIAARTLRTKVRPQKMKRIMRI